MLEETGGAESFRTRIVDDVMLRTKDGMPQFTRLKQESVGILRRGLAARPKGEGESAGVAWSPAVVFDMAFTGYVIATKDPEQLRDVFRYWVGDGGRVCGAGASLYYGLVGKLSSYSLFKKVKAPSLSLGSAPSYGVIPFVAGDAYYVATSNAVATPSGDVLVGFYPTTIYNAGGQDEIYARQLPQAISGDGTTVSFTAVDDRNFTDPFPGYFVDELCFWMATAVAPFSALSQTLVTLKAVNYTDDHVGTEDGGAYLPVTLDVEKPTWRMFIPTILKPTVTVFSWVWGGGSAGTVFYAEAYAATRIIESKDMTLGGLQRRDYRDWPLSIDVKRSAVIGRTSTAADVTLHVKCAYHRRTFGEGQTYLASRNPWPLYDANGLNMAQSYPDAAAEAGPKTWTAKQVKVEVDELNDSYIGITVGDIFALRTFEVRATTSGLATKKSCAITNRTDFHGNWSGTALHHDTVVYGTGAIVPPATAATPGVNDNLVPQPFRGAHVGGRLTGDRWYYESEYPALVELMNSQPTLATVFSQYDDKNNYDAREDDFVTSLNMEVTSRYIVGADASIGLIAYVRTRISYSGAEVVGKTSDLWIYNKSKAVPHRVECDFVIEYRTEMHVRPLFDITVEKPLTLFEAQHNNWYIWPPTKYDEDPGMWLCANQMLLPTPSAFKGIYGVFAHQGVNPDFAGFTGAETASPESAGYATGTNLNRAIYCKRFRLTDDGMDWLITATCLNECKRGATAENATGGELQAYYYSPALKEAVVDTVYEIEFDQDGFTNWPNSIPTTSNAGIPQPPDRSASCWRI